MMAPFIELQKARLLCGLLCAIFAIVFPVLAANESLIYSPDWAPCQWFASTDKKHDNEDYLTLKPGETRKIPLTPGQLERLWFTAIEPAKIKLELFNPLPYGPSLQTLFRDNRIAMAGNQTFHEKAFSWMPQGFRLDPNAFLKVTNHSKDPEGNKFFYQASIRAPQKASSLSKGAPQQVTQNIELAPGGEKTIELNGSGLIETISLSLATAQDGQNLRLRAAWDGEQKSAIDAPFAALLGLFQHGETVKSAAFDFDGKKANLKWPMPFGKGAKLTFANSGPAPLNVGVQIDFVTVNQAPPYRFYAAYGSTRTVEEKPVKIVKVTGKGAFCGLNLSITPAPDSGRRQFAYLEGNETITADGKKYEGTGTEDFFSSAWYFPQKPFSFPYHGMTYKTKLPPSVGAYRLMIPDALPFQQSLQFDFEHGNNYNSNDLLFRWVAFWYGTPQQRFEISDALQDNVPSAAPGGPSHLNIFLVALMTALIVGGGGGFIVKIARKRAEKAS